MLAAAAGCADRCTHHQRHRDLPARHVTHLGDVVDDLVGGQQKKVAVLHVDDGPHAHHRRAAGDAEEAEFGDGRVDHAIGELLLQSQGHRERAAPSARHARCLRRCRTRADRAPFPRRWPRARLRQYPDVLSSPDLFSCPRQRDGDRHFAACIFTVSRRRGNS